MSRGSRFALVSLALALMFAPLLTLHPAVAHAYDAGLSNLSIELSHPRVYGFTLMASLVALPAVGFLLFILRTVHGFGAFRALLLNSTPKSRDGMDYRLLPYDGLVAFTAGFFRPVTFVSAGAEQSLEPAEFRAALLHEEAHQRNKDILWRILLGAVGHGFRFLPWIRRVVETEMLRAECEADDYALRGGARRQDLFEAIAAASASPSSFTAAGLTDSNVELRLVRLVNPETPLPGSPTKTFLVLALAVITPAVVAHILAVAVAACSASLA